METSHHREETGSASRPPSPPCHEERELDRLRPHPSYLRNGLAVSALQLAKIEELGESAFHDPLVITTDGTVLDGYARLELAQRKKRRSLPCTVFQLDGFEALELLLIKHRQPNAWNAFNRILLALDLEPELRDEARRRQSMGGRNKLSANLPGAERFDVRSRIAAAAGVSPRNTDKAKYVLGHAVPEVLALLRDGEIRIHRGWIWSKLSPEGQRRALQQFKTENGLKKTIHVLVAAHKLKASPVPLSVSDLVQLLCESAPNRPLRVFEVDLPGNAIFVTKGLVHEGVSKEQLAS